MRLAPALAAILAAALITTCAAPADIGSGGAAGSQSAPARSDSSPTVPDLSPIGPELSSNDLLWRVSDHASALVERSCPAGTARQEPLPIELTAKPVSVGDTAQLARRIPETVTISGAWDISSPNSNFGGLSGLALLPGGNLLAVTDAGAFIWIGLENGAPATGKIAYMQGTDGTMRTGKSDADAEGLVWANGLALVSFERDFRIEAFGLEACGAAARAALIASLPDRHNGRKIDENQGPEAIFLEPDGALGFGYEGILSASPLGRVLADGTSEWIGASAPAPALHGLVGREVVALPGGGARTFELFRAWAPVQGNRIRLQWGTGPGEHLTLARPLLVDNFEGIAAEALENNEVRVWIVSDNNFSGNQRTLLYSFDVRISHN